VIRPVVLALLSMLAATGVASIVLPAAAADEDVASMMQEITQLTAEKKANEAKMQTNLSRQESARKVEADRRTFEIADQQGESAYDALCSRYKCSGDIHGGGTVSCKDGDATCQSLLSTYNAKASAQRAARAKWMASRQEATKAGGSNDELAKRNAEIDARIRELQTKIKKQQALEFTKAWAECQRRAASVAEFDASVQDLRSCVGEGPAASALPTVEKQSGRVFDQLRAKEEEMARYRAAQRAIDKYIKSGPPRPGPGSFVPVEVPKPQVPEAPQPPSKK
jgi:hypothetical protein